MKYSKAEVIDNQQITIINTYLKYKTVVKTAQELRLPYRAVHKILVASNLIKMRRKTKSSSLNKDFFKVIDSPEKAYFLGLLHADGSVFQRSTSDKFNLSISLHHRDKKILDRFARCISLEEERVLPSPQKIGELQYKITIGIQEFIEPILELKSPAILAKVPSNLTSHFIRGVFDGDGSIYNHRAHGGKQINYHASFIGYQWLLEWIQITCPVKAAKIKTTNSKEISRMEYYSQNDLLDLFSFLYKDSTVHLDRKYSKFLDMKLNYSISTTKRKASQLENRDDDIV